MHTVDVYSSHKLKMIINTVILSAYWHFGSLDIFFFQSKPTRQIRAGKQVHASYTDTLTNTHTMHVHKNHC